MEEEKPAVASTTWAKDDTQSRSWLWNNMEPHVICHVMLLQLHMQCGPWWKTRMVLKDIWLMRRDFLTRQDNRPLHELHSSVTAKWELNLYQPYPGDLATWKKQMENLQVITFLVALDTQYESAKLQLLTSVELPTLDVSQCWRRWSSICHSSPHPPPPVQ